MTTYKRIEVSLRTVKQRTNMQLNGNLHYHQTPILVSKGVNVVVDFLSDEKPKEGEWFIYEYENKKVLLRAKTINTDTISVENHIEVGSWVGLKYCKKIIASNDEHLGLWKLSTQGGSKVDFNPIIPQLPQSFIEHYIAEYNKGNIIKFVDVEYDTSQCIGCQSNLPVSKGIHLDNQTFGIICNKKLKINPDNTIDIKPMASNTLQIELIRLRERYKTLSELWNPKSEHQMHLKISKMIDETLVKIEEVMGKIDEMTKVE